MASETGRLINTLSMALSVFAQLYFDPVYCCFTGQNAGTWNFLVPRCLFLLKRVFRTLNYNHSNKPSFNDGRLMIGCDYAWGKTKHTYVTFLLWKSKHFIFQIVDLCVLILLNFINITFIKIASLLGEGEFKPYFRIL